MRARVAGSRTLRAASSAFKASPSFVRAPSASPCATMNLARHERDLTACGGLRRAGFGGLEVRGGAREIRVVALDAREIEEQHRGWLRARRALEEIARHVELALAKLDLAHRPADARGRRLELELRALGDAEDRFGSAKRAPGRVRIVGLRRSLERSLRDEQRLIERHGIRMGLARLDEHGRARLAHAERLEELREGQRRLQRCRIAAVRFGRRRDERRREEIAIDDRIVIVVFIVRQERVEDLAPVLALVLARERGDRGEEATRRGLAQPVVVIERVDGAPRVTVAQVERDDCRRRRLPRAHGLDAIVPGPRRERMHGRREPHARRGGRGIERVLARLEEGAGERHALKLGRCVHARVDAGVADGHALCGLRVVGPRGERVEVRLERLRPAPARRLERASRRGRGSALRHRAARPP